MEMIVTTWTDRELTESLCKYVIQSDYVAGVELSLTYPIK